ncbi:MAG: TusE/DsrC/DsvC family sulfur relay protein [Proteobacteria bacterium]|nr:TusE/DsrC/DsvC family sulfur relay protein [Pseudomonadota bacterium]
MSIEVNGMTLETDESGYLAEIGDWNEEVALAIGAADQLEMTDQHMDVVRYLRSEHVDNAGNEPNERTIMKDMGKVWGKKPSSKDMYTLFPGTPSKQGRKIAGLPRSTRKGGY